MSPISNFLERKHPDTIVLFDVDGTLTPARQVSYQYWHNCCSMMHKAYNNMAFD